MEMAPSNGNEGIGRGNLAGWANRFSPDREIG